MKNSYEVRGDVTAIFIQWKGETLECLIDTEDLETVSSIPGTWHAMIRTHTFYIKTNKRLAGESRLTIFIHRLVMNPPKGLTVDHINGNGLDNRKRNMRNCTQGENVQNRKGFSASGERNVYWHNRAQKWQVMLRVDGRIKCFGSYEELHEAATVAREARKEHFPFAVEEEDRIS